MTGANALELPAGQATVWSRGSVVEVAWGMWANHGGGCVREGWGVDCIALSPSLVTSARTFNSAEFG